MGLRVFHGECDWVVAESTEDAWKVWCESTGEKREDYEDVFDWTAEPDDQMMTIWNDEGFDRCDCRQVLEAHRKAEERKLALIDMQPEQVRPMLRAKLPKGPRVHPNGHLLTCTVGCDRMTFGQWAESNGRGFLASTEF